MHVILAGEDEDHIDGSVPETVGPVAQHPFVEGFLVEILLERENERMIKIVVRHRHRCWPVRMYCTCRLSKRNHKSAAVHRRNVSPSTPPADVAQ